MKSEGRRFNSHSRYLFGGDGDVEICVSGYEAAVICVNGVDGSLVWANGTENTYVGAPAIADFDEDGDAEVAFGRQIFDSWGNLIGMGTGGDGYQAMSVAVDWDGDGDLDVLHDSHQRTLAAQLDGLHGGASRVSVPHLRVDNRLGAFNLDEVGVHVVHD